NAVLLAIGTLMASFVGTTGAAMILIRPLLRANITRAHNVARHRFLLDHPGTLVRNRVGCQPGAGRLRCHRLLVLSCGPRLRAGDETASVRSDPDPRWPEPGADRGDPRCDPAVGGMGSARHVRYSRDRAAARKCASRRSARLHRGCFAAARLGGA